jgi:NADH-quinone oxidoreductase subunit C
MAVLHSAPKYTSNDGVLDKLLESLSVWLDGSREEHGEIILTAKRDDIATVLKTLRDDHAYQQLMEIAGADYPDRPERFEVVYMLLSLTKNHRIMVKCSTDEATPVPSVTDLWPNAGWLEREVFDLYGVVFAGNQDLRRILTDYGFEGHPFRKDFPMTGYTELRYSEDEKRVVYEPVELAQDMRTFDFLSPWEGADYVLPGDEKASGAPDVEKPKVTETPADTGAGPKAEELAEEGTEAVPPDMIEIDVTDEEIAPDPTENRPDREPSKGDVHGTKAATEPEEDDT